MFSKNDIPQADNLNKVTETVEAIADGARTSDHIAQEIGY